MPKLALEGRSGKIELVNRHDLLSSESIQTIRQFDKIRNRYIHDVKDIVKTLQEIVVELDSANSGEFTRHMMRFLIKRKAGSEAAQRRLHEETRFWLVINFLFVMSNAYGYTRPPPIPKGSILSAIFGSEALKGPNAGGADEQDSQTSTAQ